MKKSIFVVNNTEINNMRGRPAIYDNQDILEKAQQVFWTQGYTATSLEDILQAMGIGSGSFYNAFKGGKKELFIETIRQRRTAFDDFQKSVSTSEKPIDLIKDFFRSIASADIRIHKQGCFIVNTVVEMAGLDAEIESEAINILKDVESFYTSTIKAAQEDGTLKNQTDPILLGRYLINLWNGINVTRRMYADSQELGPLIEMQLAVIN
ncbi:TetR/AcrR family transcriptional regulator [Pedobacter antarcticus]|uniref:TetR/AcrR family transcriptional regulator n=1 Tax=Pedobacter antarcticus TaxID=34086 RepID=UPI00292D2630|nr:TetR/AcrR family transcriptional regulator [Pedobacter antarcticus]